MQPKGCLKVVFLACFKGCSVILCVAYLVTGLNFFAIVFCLPVYLVVLVSAWLSFGLIPSSCLPWATWMCTPSSLLS